MNKARPIAHSSILRPLTVVIARLGEDKSVYRNLNSHLTLKGPSHNHLVLRVARRGRSFCPAETKGNSLPAGQEP